MIRKLEHVDPTELDFRKRPLRDLRRHDQHDDYCGCNGVRAPQAWQVIAFSTVYATEFRHKSRRKNDAAPACARPWWLANDKMSAEMMKSPRSHKATGPGSSSPGYNGAVKSAEERKVWPHAKQALFSSLPFVQDCYCPGLP